MATRPTAKPARVTASAPTPAAASLRPAASSGRSITRRSGASSIAAAATRVAGKAPSGGFRRLLDLFVGDRQLLLRQALIGEVAEGQRDDISRLERQQRDPRRADEESDEGADAQERDADMAARQPDPL